MKQYNIGLDFGTYQTKACILDIENDTHEFFRFPNSTFFLLSKVSLTTDNKFEYGNTITTAKREYFYFKIASAEDPEFRVETFDDSKKIPHRSDIHHLFPKAVLSLNSGKSQFAKIQVVSINIACKKKYFCMLHYE